MSQEIRFTYLVQSLNTNYPLFSFVINFDIMFCFSYYNFHYFKSVFESNIYQIIIYVKKSAPIVKMELEEFHKCLSVIPSFYYPPSAKKPLLSLQIILPEWSHTVCSILCLVSFTQSQVCAVVPFCTLEIQQLFIFMSSTNLY